MFGFGDDEDTTPPQLSEFQSVAQSVVDQAPNPDAGLAALRDIYGEYQFEDKDKAESAFVQASDSVRRKFGDTRAYDYDTVMKGAPVAITDVIGEGKDSDSRRIDQINKWEQQNISAIDKIDDPVYLQSKNQLVRGVKQAATMQRRQIYGADNYIVTDAALRFAQGSIGGIASLFGADGVNDWFTERENPDNDDKFWASLASGAGTGLTAVGVGALTGGLGAGAYLAASGAGAVREQYETAKEEGASTGEALEAAGIEAAGQVGQVLVGGKVFGKAAEKIAGRAVSELGARVFPRILGNAAAEGTAMAGAHIMSNIGEAVGAGREVTPDDITRGTGTALGVGMIVAGGVHGLAEYRGRGRAGNAPAHDNSDTNASQPAAPDGGGIGELSKVIDQADGSVPPAPEAVRGQYRSIAGEELSTAYTTENPSVRYVTEGDKLYPQVIDENGTQKTLSAYDHTFYMDADKAEELRDLVSGHAPDGTAITLTSDGKKLYVESNFINPDLTVDADRHPEIRHATLATKNPEVGKVPVWVNETRTQDGVRQNSFFIGPSPIKEATAVGNAYSTAGAAYVNDMGYKERGYAKTLREKYGYEEAEARGMQTTSYTENAEGERVAKDVPLWNYLSRTNVEGFGWANDFLTQNGFIKSLDYLKGKDIHTADDQNLGWMIYKKAEAAYNKAVFDASKTGDWTTADRLKDLYHETEQVYTEMGTPVGQAEQARTEAAHSKMPGASGEAAVSDILTEYQKQAQTAVEGKFGKGVSVTSLREEVKTADAEVAEAEKAVAEPVTQRIAELDAEHQLINEKREAQVNEQIKGHTEDIHTLEGKLTETKEKMQGALTDVDKELKSQITDTENQLKEANDKVAARESETLEPTKDIVKREEAAATRVEELTTKQETARKELEEKLPQKKTELQSQVRRAEENVSKAQDRLRNYEDSTGARPAAQKGKEAQYRDAKARIAEAEKELSQKKRELERISKQEADTRVRHEKLTSSLESAKQKLESIRGEKTERTSTTKRATKNLTDTRDRIQNKLNKLREQYDQVSGMKGASDKKVAAVKKIRSLIAERKQAIRKLEQSKKQEPLLTSRQRQIQAEKERISTAQKEGRIKVSADKQEALTQAKLKQARAAEKLGAAQKIVSDKIKEVSTEDMDKLRGIHKVIDSMPEGSVEKQKAKIAAAKIMAKYIETPRDTYNLFRYWRDQILTGINTQIRNITGYISTSTSTLVAYPVTGLASDAIRVATGGRVNYNATTFDTLRYFQGFLHGMKQSAPEAMSILRGERRYRASFDPTFEGSAPMRMKDWANKWEKHPVLGYTVGTLLAPGEMARRLMTTGDAFFHGSAATGQAYMLGEIAAREAKVPIGQRRAWIENKLFNTENHLKQFKAEASERARLMREAGIEWSPREEAASAYHAMEMRRDRILRNTSNRHGDRNILVQEPEGFLGAIAKGLMKMRDFEFGIGKAQIKPFEYAFPFLRVAANLGNLYLEHTPVGFLKASEYGGMRGKFKAFREYQGTMDKISELRSKGDAVSLKEASKLEKGIPKDVFDPHLEQREIAGRALVGSALLAGFYGVMTHYINDPDPWFEIYGNVPRGKEREWMQNNIEPYSMRFGDTMIGFKGTSLAMMCAILGGAKESLKRGGDKTDTATSVMVASIGSIADMSFIKSAATTFNVLTGATMGSVDSSEKAGVAFNNWWKQIGADTATGFIPGSALLRNVSRWMESTPRETYNNFGAKVLANIPFASGSYTEPRLNIFGRPIEKNPLDTTVMREYYTKLTPDKHFLWLMESGHSISDPGPVVKLTPTEARHYGEDEKSLYGYHDILTEEQSRKVLQISGPQIELLVQQLSENPNFAVATKKTQDYLNQQVSKIRARARYQVLHENY